MKHVGQRANGKDVVSQEQIAGKNLIINGKFDLWQRGTTQTTSGYGSADRWLANNNGSTKTTSRQSFTPGQTVVSNNPTYFYRTVVSTAAGAANFAATNQYIEDVTRLSGQTVTVSFSAKADTTKSMAFEMTQGFGTGGSPSAAVVGLGAQKISMTSAWQQYVVTVALPSITGKTLGTNGDSSTALSFWFDAGTNYTSRTSNLGQQSGTFDIANVKVEFGAVATAWEPRSPAEELTLCQRYFAVISPSSRYFNSSGIATSFGTTIGWPVTMRAVPATSITSTGTNNNVANTVLSAYTVNSGYLQLTSGASASDTYLLQGTATLDAELAQ